MNPKLRERVERAREREARRFTAPAADLVVKTRRKNPHENGGNPGLIDAHAGSIRLSLTTSFKSEALHYALLSVKRSLGRVIIDEIVDMSVRNSPEKAEGGKSIRPRDGGQD